jgi:hypothetical protein
MPINISINIKMDVPSNIIVLGKSTYIKDRYGTPVILLKYCDFLLLLYLDHCLKINTALNSEFLRENTKKCGTE